MKTHLKITQTKSTIGRATTFCTSLAALGLKGVNSTVVVANTPSFRGAVKKVIHLVSVEEVNHG